jgi:hypothetical protein
MSPDGDGSSRKTPSWTFMLAVADHGLTSPVALAWARQ